MREDEYGEWLPRMRQSYAEDMIGNGGVSEERAQAKASDDIERLFPGGQPSSDQIVFVIEADDQPVGELWVAERDADIVPSLWIYDVHVAEAYRGRGYGKAAMRYAEEEARRRGVGDVALMVLGGNDVARSLYRSLGYAENAVFMSRHV